MKQHAVFYLLVGPYGVVPAPLEVFFCEADDAESALEQFAFAGIAGAPQFVMVEVERK